MFNTKGKFWVFYTTINGSDHLFGKNKMSIRLDDKWYFFYDMEKYAFKTKKAILGHFRKMTMKPLKVLEYTYEKENFAPKSIKYVKDILLEEVL